MRHKNQTSSVISAALILPFPIIFNPHDFVLLMLSFIILQLAMVLASAFLILLRITSLLKNKNYWFYYFSATMQAGLCVEDIILLFNQDIIKSSLLTFLALNGMLASIIFYDIYKTPNGKGNLAGDQGSPMLIN
jgi:hypothetical protein